MKTNTLFPQISKTTLTLCLSGMKNGESKSTNQSPLTLLLHFVSLLAQKSSLVTFQSQLVKYSGLTFDRRLTSALHIRTKKLVLNEWIRLIKTLISNKYTKLLIYKSLIQPMWTCGLQLWGNANKSNMNEIQTVKNKILRTITNAL